jgi:hypothetical protein
MWTPLKAMYYKLYLHPCLKQKLLLLVAKILIKEKV